MEGDHPMSYHTPEKLWSLWQREQLDTDMATGQMLQNLVKHNRALAAANVTLYQLRDRVKTQQADLVMLKADLKQLQGVVDRLTALIEGRRAAGKE